MRIMAKAVTDKPVPRQDELPYKQGWAIRDKVTGRHLAYVYQDVTAGNYDALSQVFYVAPTDNADDDLVGPHASLGDCGDAVWTHSMGRRDKLTWRVLATLVYVADATSAFAKLSVKIALAVLSIWAVYNLAVLIANGDPMLSEALGSWLRRAVEQ